MDKVTDRFWAKVDKAGPVPTARPELGPCWLWTAATHDAGYGMVRLGKRTVRAHRVAYELLVRPIPEGTELDHLCRVRPCVNPGHLDPVDHQTNMARGVFGMKTHCPQGHPYEGGNLYVCTNGGRECRTCRRAQYEAYRDRHHVPRVPKDHCSKNHPYDEANTYINKRGGRDCRACRVIAVRESRARRKARQEV